MRKSTNMKKLLLTLGLLLGLAPFGLAQAGSSYYDIVLDTGGHPISNAIVRVYVAGSCATSCTYTTIYSDPGLTSPVNQSTSPIVTDAGGNYVFFTTASAVDIGITGRGVTKILADVTLAANTGNIFYANSFPGGSVSAQINNALAACPAYSNVLDNGCVVVLSPGMACGEGSQAKDNVTIIDYRNCAASQGIRYSLSALAGGGIRSKMYLGDNFNFSPSVLSGNQSTATLYVHSYPDHPDTTTGTVAAMNGSISIDSLGGNFTGALVGFEGEAGANSTNGTPYTVSDVRGGTFNVNCGGDTNCTRLVSLYAQAPTSSTSGTITNAFSLQVDSPTISVTGESEAALINGTMRVADRFALGGAGTSSVAMFVGTPANLSGANESIFQAAGTTSAGATSAGQGGVFRADVSPSTTQVTNTGIYVQTPSIGSGGAITTWAGIHVQKAPVVSTQACSLALEGATSGTSCFNVPAAATANVYPVLVASLSTAAATTDTVAITGMTSSGHCTFSATNASAATNIATTYISAKTTNQITVTHTATASMTYDIMCTSN